MTQAAGYTLFQTAFGTYGLAWSDRGAMRSVLPEGTAIDTETRLCRQAGTDRRAKPPAEIGNLVGAIQSYFEGKDVDFRRVPVDLSATDDFERRVYEALRGVGWGDTTTYGALARIAGSPGAARAVGRAMARNPLPVIVPCHRVLAAGGTIGGFSAHGGVTTKQRMLALERVLLAV